MYLLLGPITWGFFTFGMFKGRGRMMLLTRPPKDLPKDPPHVTILIPAKDEGERIRDCINSALNQDYPNFDVIAIDDRSTDITGRIMDELAERSSKLRVNHIIEGALPAGWTGKCNALHTTVNQASGSWLLFVDSDVVLQPDVLRATIATAVERRFDLISLLPALEGHTFWENLVVPLAGCAVATMYLVALTNTNEQKTAFANGQYLCIRRDVYDAIGGHLSVRDRFCEDVEMARILKARGFRPRISWGADFAAVRMYSSLRSIFRGWGRNFFAGSLGRPWRILAAIGFVILCCFSAYAAFIWGIYRNIHPASFVKGWLWLTTSVAHLIIMTGAMAIMYSWSKNRRSYALLFPLGAAMLLGVFSRSLWMCLTGRVEWRGTRYAHRMDPALAPLPAAEIAKEQV
ncbi:MAG TPA: glycosyltransferase [Tepidisphaeraceae bacterium]|nr:glycosyltransferase [Tepidisphaeraceae bacterium]